jgi:hypothetical protein
MLLTKTFSIEEDGKTVLKISEDLLTVERAAKADTGTVGPELFNVIEQLDKITDANRKILDVDFTLTGVNTIIPELGRNLDGSRKMIVNADNAKITQLLGFIQVLITEANENIKLFNKNFMKKLTTNIMQNEKIMLNMKPKKHTCVQMKIM